MTNPFADRPRKPLSLRAFAVVDQSGAIKAVRLAQGEANSLALGVDGHYVVPGRFEPDEVRPQRPPANAVRRPEPAR